MTQATVSELRGRFTRHEIIALAYAFKDITPTWRLMANTSVLVARAEDAERSQRSITDNGANPVALVEKLRALTAAQATILQFQLINFWNSPRKGKGAPDLEQLIKSLS
jgi:hypothetical protein